VSCTWRLSCGLCSCSPAARALSAHARTASLLFVDPMRGRWCCRSTFSFPSSGETCGCDLLPIAGHCKRAHQRGAALAREVGPIALTEQQARYVASRFVLPRPTSIHLAHWRQSRSAGNLRRSYSSCHARSVTIPILQFEVCFQISDRSICVWIRVTEVLLPPQLNTDNRAVQSTD
jgi:hypothetical protein